MRKYRGIIAEVGGERIRRLIENVSLKAHADDGGEGNDPEVDEKEDGDSHTTINYEDLISKARADEKKKQYKTIEGLKKQVDTLTKQHNDDLLVVAQLKEDLAKAEEKLTSAGSGDSEAVKTLKNEVETLKAEKEAAEKKVRDFEQTPPQSREDIEKEVRAELEAEYKVKSYKVEKMAEYKDQILVPELVGGDTEEAIDESIKAALIRSDEIRKSLGVTTTTTQQKPAKRTPRTPSNPSTSGVQQKEISMEYLAGLDVRSKEYAEVRKQLGLH